MSIRVCWHVRNCLISCNVCYFIISCMQGQAVLIHLGSLSNFTFATTNSRWSNVSLLTEWRKQVPHQTYIPVRQLALAIPQKTRKAFYDWLKLVGIFQTTNAITFPARLPFHWSVCNDRSLKYPAHKQPHREFVQMAQTKKKAIGGVDRPTQRRGQ